MEEEKLVVEEKMGPVKDLHAKFEKTPLRKPLGEIPTASSRLGKEESLINMKSTLQKWENKTYTPFLTPQKQKLVEPEMVTRSEPRGGRFTRGRNFNFDRDDENDDDDESGGTTRRTSMPAVGAVKNALKQYLANTGQSGKDVKNVTSPHPSQNTKSRRALVPKMRSIEEDGEDNDENQPVSIKVPTTKPQSASIDTGSDTGTTSSFEVGLKGQQNASAKSKLEADAKPMNKWKFPAKSISKTNTPCKSKGYIFDEFAVGLKALKSPKKTKMEDEPLTVSGSLDIDEPSVVNSFEIGLKALRTPKRGAIQPDVKEVKQEKTEAAVGSFAVGLKALRTPKKAVDVKNEMSCENDEPEGEVKSFKVGLKALRKPENSALEKKLSKIEKKIQERNFGVDLKSTITSRKPRATDTEIDVKQTFVTLKPTATKTAKQDTVNEETNLTDLKSKLKRTGKLGQEREHAKSSTTNGESSDEYADWKMAKSKLKPVTIDEKISKLNEEDTNEKGHDPEEHLDIREDKIDWNQAKQRLKHVAPLETCATKMETDDEAASTSECDDGVRDVGPNVEADDEVVTSTNEHEDDVGDTRLSALSKSNPMDETLLVDMNDTVSDGELEGMVKCNMSPLGDSTLQLGDALAENRNDVEKGESVEPKKKGFGKSEVQEEPVKSPKKRPNDYDRDDEKDVVLRKVEREDQEEHVNMGRLAELPKLKKRENSQENEASKGNVTENSSPPEGVHVTKCIEENSEEKDSVGDRKRVRSDDSETSQSSRESSKEDASIISAKGLSNKAPCKKKQKLVSNDDTDCLSAGLSPGNLFIDPKTPDTTQTSQSSQGESEMDTSPVKSPVNLRSNSDKEFTSSTAAPSKLKRGTSQENEANKGNVTEKSSPPEGVHATKYSDEEECKIFSSTPAGDQSYPLKKRTKIDTPMSESRFALGTTRSPAVTHKKLDCSVEEYSETTTDIIKRWRERRHFLNLKGSPRTVAERMEEEEIGTDSKDQHPLLTLDEDSAHSKVSHFLSSLPSASNGKDVNMDQPDVPDAKSRLSSASKRSSTLSHCSVRSREEMEADLDKGMRELEKRLHMFDDDDDDGCSPICSTIRKGPPHFAAKINKASAKVSKRGKEETISESDEEMKDEDQPGNKRLQPSTSGSDVLDFVQEKRTRLMQIQDESIHLDSDTDADDSQLQPNPYMGYERVSRMRQGRQSPMMGINSRRRRRSRSVGRPVAELGPSSPQNTYREKALNRLGLCTPARQRIQPRGPRLGTAQSQVDALCTPYGSRRLQKTHTSSSGNVYIVDMNCSDDDSDDRYLNYSIHLY